MRRYCESDDVDAAHWTREHAADRIVAAAKIRESLVEENRVTFAVFSGVSDGGGKRYD